MTTTINGTILHPNGDPRAHGRVTFQLVAGGAGGSNGAALIVDTRTVHLSATGTFSEAFTGNDAITPAGSYYAVTVIDAQPAVLRYIQFDDNAGPFDVDDPAIQLSAPTPPELYPVPSAGTADQVLQTDGSTASWATLAASGGASYAAAPYFMLATSAVDGTATTFDVLSYSHNASASGDIPANYVSSTSFTSLAAFQSALTGAGFGTTPTTVAVMGTSANAGFYSISAATVDSAWTEVVAPVGFGVGAAAGFTILNIDGTTELLAAAGVAQSGTGLSAGTSDAQAAAYDVEGILDRSRWISAVATSDVDTDDFGNATFEYGALNFLDGSAVATTHCYVWLQGQTTSSENGIWQVDVTTYNGTQFSDPDVFDPPGNGSKRKLSLPGDEHDGMEWEWFDDDPTKWQRVSTATPASTEGRWLITRDPTASSSGGPSYSFVTSDQTVNNTTTLANVSGLSFAVTSGKKYPFVAKVWVDGDTNADCKLGVTCPAGTLKATALGLINSASSHPSNTWRQTTITASGGATDRLGAYTGEEVLHTMEGIFIATADGTVQIQHAQRSAVVADSTVKVGSFIEWTEQS